jgi:pimeloyl-ACP methyl ester carboxylesterase
MRQFVSNGAAGHRSGDAVCGRKFLFRSNWRWVHVIPHKSESGLVSTRLGRLYVAQVGSGPPAMLWHSLWVDSRSWGPLVHAFAAHRRVVMIDGPGYGGSSPIHRDFTLNECAEATREVLDQLGISEPVDWVGNAWGGHVGIILAVSHPHRLRSLVTIAAPLTRSAVANGGRKRIHSRWSTALRARTASSPKRCSMRCSAPKRSRLSLFGPRR